MSAGWKTLDKPNDSFTIDISEDEDLDDHQRLIQSWGLISWLEEDEKEAHCCCHSVEKSYTPLEYTYFSNAFFAVLLTSL